MESEFKRKPGRPRKNPLAEGEGNLPPASDSEEKPEDCYHLTEHTNEHGA